MIKVSDIITTAPAEFKTEVQKKVYQTLEKLDIPFERIDTEDAITMEDCQAIDSKFGFKTVKTVSRVLYGTPLLDERQRRFWEWVADYYMCTLGEVMRVALPSLMKPSGHGEEEFAADEFRPRREWFVALAGEALTADGLAAALERMGRRAPRQREALEELAALAPDGAEVARSRLAADRTALALLVKKGLLTCIEREVAPGPVTGGAQFRLPTLSAAQRKAA